MSLSSYSFIFFFLLFVLVFLTCLKMKRGSLLWVLIAGSLVFYGSGSWKSLPLLAGSVLANFLFSGLIEKVKKTSQKKIIFIAAITLNGLLLATFKYLGFLTESLLFWTSLKSPQLFFPLGISFFTLTQIMFLVDRYQGIVKHPAFSEFVSFVSFFPTITAGPICRWKDLGLQISQLQYRLIDWDLIARGIFLFALGFAKKIILADTFAIWADLGFQNSATLSGPMSWISSLAYTFQIYFDFSGYSDMAIGAALIMQISIPANFNSPLRAVSLIDFWKRWHISLSQFITSYLYTPMLKAGGKKITFEKAMVTTVLAMTIAGLWHGPSWNFILFGFLHGIVLVVNNVWRKKKLRCPDPVGWILTFLFVNFAFVIFRSQNLADAFSMIRSMFLGSLHNWNGDMIAQVLSTTEQLISALIMIVGAGIILRTKDSSDYCREFQPTKKNLAVAVVFFIFSLLLLNTVVSKIFIYADF